MSFWDMILTAYEEMCMAANLAHQECITLLDKRRFDEAKKFGESRTGYYECAIAALNLL